MLVLLTGPTCHESAPNTNPKESYPLRRRLQSNQIKFNDANIAKAREHAESTETLFLCCYRFLSLEEGTSHPPLPGLLLTRQIYANTMSLHYVLALRFLMRSHEAKLNFKSTSSMQNKTSIITVFKCLQTALIDASCFLKS